MLKRKPSKSANDLSENDQKRTSLGLSQGIIVKRRIRTVNNQRIPRISQQLKRSPNAGKELVITVAESESRPPISLFLGSRFRPIPVELVFVPLVTMESSVV